jgi:DNA modification methylase
VDCCVTSPPYYLQDDYNDDRQVGREKTPEQYVQRLVQIFAEVRRLLKRYGTVWINIGDTQCYGVSLLIPHRLAIALNDDGWLLRSEIIIERANPIPCGQMPFQRTHEMLLLLATSRAHYSEPTERTSVWRIPHVVTNVGGHPCPMPMPLAKECIVAGCPPGGTVLDMFRGVGTTAIAAVESHRHAIGIDLSDYYLTFARWQLLGGFVAAAS